MPGQGGGQHVEAGVLGSRWWLCMSFQVERVEEARGPTSAKGLRSHPSRVQEVWQNSGVGHHAPFTSVCSGDLLLILLVNEFSKFIFSFFSVRFISFLSPHGQNLSLQFSFTLISLAFRGSKARIFSFGGPNRTLEVLLVMED